MHPAPPRDPARLTVGYWLGRMGGVQTLGTSYLVRLARELAETLDHLPVPPIDLDTLLRQLLAQARQAMDAERARALRDLAFAEQSLAPLPVRIARAPQRLRRTPRGRVA